MEDKSSKHSYDHLRNENERLKKQILKFDKIQVIDSTAELQVITEGVNIADLRFTLADCKREYDVRLQAYTENLQFNDEYLNRN